MQRRRLLQRPTSHSSLQRTRQRARGWWGTRVFHSLLTFKRASPAHTDDRGRMRCLLLAWLCSRSDCIAPLQVHFEIRAGRTFGAARRTHPYLQAGQFSWPIELETCPVRRLSIADRKLDTASELAIPGVRSACSSNKALSLGRRFARLNFAANSCKAYVSA